MATVLGLQCLASSALRQARRGAARVAERRPCPLLSSESWTLTRIKSHKLRPATPMFMLRQGPDGKGPLNPSPSKILVSNQWALSQRMQKPGVCQARRGLGFLSEMETLKEQKTEEESAGSSPSPLDFEAPLEVVLYPEPKLRAPNKLVTEFSSGKLQRLAEEMLEAMYRTDGVGLSAPQVGVNTRLMVYNPFGEKGKGEEYVLVNPRIVKTTKATDTETEGCLSFLEITGDVERPVGVKVDAQDVKGRRFSLSLKGWQARIFQHEYDHLQGKLFFERMTPEVLDSIREDLLELESAYETRTKLKRPETVGTK